MGESLIKFVLFEVLNDIDGGDSFSYDFGNRDKINFFVLSVIDQNRSRSNDMPTTMVFC
jgi:hypothetical protein